MRLSRRRSLTRQSLMGMLTFASEEIDRIERLETYIESIRSFVSEVDSGTHKHWSLDDSGQLKPITGDDATDAMIHYRRIRRAFMETMESLLPDRRARGSSYAATSPATTRRPHNSFWSEYMVAILP